MYVLLLSQLVPSLQPYVPQPATLRAQVKHTVYSDFDVDNWYVPSQLRPLPASYVPLIGSGASQLHPLIGCAS